jgi:hypothetical protein
MLFFRTRALAVEDGGAEIILAPRIAPDTIYRSIRRRFPLGGDELIEGRDSARENKASRAIV